MSPTTHAVTDKALDTLKARFALAGLELTIETGLDGSKRYIVQLHGRVREFKTVTQLEVLLDVIGGVP
ncbi:hypothetical protein [Variovorax paradoxus]|uniref:hypothetical protein n=1 Tax=Variovorax paradoxus TaxID=34073 RepID=UPI002787FB60|nr:hypothetical protein [Variovorax paradoxus]MDQ0590992.1 hypothetical protein [Variovorax paradoxus]